MLVDLDEKDKKAYSLIRNKLIHEGKRPTLKEINAVTGGKSPRSASLVIDRLIRMRLLRKVGKTLKLAESQLLNNTSITTINIPLVGSVACGLPILAQENIETYIPISTAFAKEGSRYFLLRACGDSMDEAGINDGDILLVRKQNYADDGKKVVALINDEATVKILDRRAGAVILRPKSSNSTHKPIVVTDNCQIQGEVITVLPSDLY
jgi:repressor LexA